MHARSCGGLLTFANAMIAPCAEREARVVNAIIVEGPVLKVFVGMPACHHVMEEHKKVAAGKIVVQLPSADSPYRSIQERRKQ